jgi:hypothetical protein
MIKDIMQPYPFSLGYTNIYSLPVIVVYKDDSVTVNLFNIAETEEESKTFIHNPYPPYSLYINAAAENLEMQPLQLIKKRSPIPLQVPS